VHRFRGATIDKVAVWESISRPNLLYYFARKDDVYVAVRANTHTNWIEPLKQLGAKADLA